MFMHILTHKIDDIIMFLCLVVSTEIKNLTVKINLRYGVLHL